MILAVISLLQVPSVLNYSKETKAVAALKEGTLCAVGGVCWVVSVNDFMGNSTGTNKEQHQLQPVLHLEPTSVSF